MKKIIAIILTLFALFVAYSSKPDDKTCTLKAVRAVWGNAVPTEEKPLYFEPFMDNISQSVKINDYVFLKRIQYKTNTGYKTVGVGIFNKVVTF
jgi:hypothetical protein